MGKLLCWLGFHKWEKTVTAGEAYLSLRRLRRSASNATHLIFGRRLEELRAVLLREHVGRVRDGLV